jgi:hypothetical protein
VAQVSLVIWAAGIILWFWFTPASTASEMLARVGRLQAARAAAYVLAFASGTALLKRQTDLSWVDTVICLAAPASLAVLATAAANWLASGMVFR